MHPDPLEFLYRYDEVRDREVVGLVASTLAYGRVNQILSSVEKALGVLGPEPARFVTDTSDKEVRRLFKGFKHRFTTGSDMAALLVGAGRAVQVHGSLNTCFEAGLDPRDETVVPAMERFATEVMGLAGCQCDFTLPSTAGGSACKRLNLYLRWMVRRDEVDPGGWDGISPSMLVIPLDTHMFRTGLALGMTRRKTADLKTALEITEGFRRIAPEDPVRYDFCLTRLGIREEMSLLDFLEGIEESQG